MTAGMLLLGRGSVEDDRGNGLAWTRERTRMTAGMVLLGRGSVQDGRGNGPAWTRERAG